MAEWQPKVKYYIKSGNGYVSRIESDIPIMADSKDLAREFTDLAVAQATAQKLIDAGFEAVIEISEEMVLDEGVV